MRALLLAALFFVATAVFGIARAGSQFESAAWQEACELSRYSCRSIKPPVVEYDETARMTGLLGYYLLGTRVVFLAVGLKPHAEYAVLVHEMVHYLQYVHAKYDPSVKLEKCFMESEAFSVSDQVAKRLGVPEMIRDGNLLDYGC